MKEPLPRGLACKSREKKDFDKEDRKYPFTQTENLLKDQRRYRPRHEPVRHQGSEPTRHLHTVS
jgi:hypothetical protein